MHKTPAPITANRVFDCVYLAGNVLMTFKYVMPETYSINTPLLGQPLSEREVLDVYK